MISSFSSDMLIYLIHRAYRSQTVLRYPAMYGMAPYQVQRFALVCRDGAGQPSSQIHAHVGLHKLRRAVLEKKARPGTNTVGLKIQHTCNSHLATLLVETSRDFLLEVNRAIIDQYPLADFPRRSYLVDCLRLQVTKYSEVQDLSKRQLSEYERPSGSAYSPQNCYSQDPSIPASIP